MTFGLSKTWNSRVKTASHTHTHTVSQDFTDQVGMGRTHIIALVISPYTFSDPV